MSTLQNNIASLEALVTKAKALPDITIPLSDLNAANGGTAATTIGAAVDNTEAHASSQESLIAQIAEALEGKAGGGLGGAVDTCTVHLLCNHSDMRCIVATQYINGNIVPYIDGRYVTQDDSYIYDATIDNVVCGSAIYITTVSFVVAAYSVTGGAEHLNTGGYNYGNWVFKAPTTPNVTGEITLWDDD